MSTRKSHKPKRQWKSSAEPGNPESSQVIAGSSSSDAAALVPSTSDQAKDVPEALEEAANLVAIPVTQGGHSGVLVVKDVKQEYWYRPPDSKARKLFNKIAVLREAGHEDEAIAKRIGTTPQSVRQYVYLAKKNGWADNDGEPIDLEAEMALNVDRKLVRNLNNALDGGMTNWQTHEVTLELAKRRKVVSDVQDGAGSQALPGVVAIQVVMPALGAEQQVVVEGNVGGVPAFLEAEVVDGTRQAESGQAGAEVNQAGAATI